METNKKKKEEIRRQLLERRSSIAEDDYLTWSEQIISRLQKQSSFQQAKTVHCYVSMNNRGEVNTHPLLKKMLAGKKNVVVPITEVASGTLRHTTLETFGDLEVNDWGVLEPSSEEEVAAGELDLVIVPMVGGDYKGNRIGYGRGFYDRFLSDIRGPKIGLLFERCLIDKVPTESFDVPLDAIITEERIIQN